MQVRLGNFTPTRQHVIVTLTNNISAEDFSEEIGFSIKDVNPENKAGLPKYEVLLNATYLSQNIEQKQHVNVSLFEENMLNLLAFLKSKKKGENKINVVIKTQPIVNLSYATSLNLISNAEQEHFNILVFASTKEEMNIFSEIQEAIFKVKDIKTKFTDFKSTCENLVSSGIASPSVEKIIERTFGFKEDLTGKRVFIIDTHNFYYRNYFAMGALSSSKGEPTAVIKALTVFLKKLHNDEGRPDYVVFASEGKNGIRFKIYDEYKANREETPEDLVFQIKTCNELLEKIGFPVISEEGFEADDVIGAYAKLFSEKNAEVTIFSTDKDMYQLLSDKVKIYDPMKQKFIGLLECNEKFAVNPEHVVYSLALSGDTSDNVPGVKGVGPKKGGPLIQKYGSLESIYENLSDIPGKLKENLAENKNNAFLSYQLVRLYDFIAEDRNTKDFKYPTYDIFYPIKADLERFEINV